MHLHGAMVQIMAPLTKSLDDLGKFVGIMDDCGAVYGRRYRAALDGLRSAINTNNTGPAATSDGSMAGSVTHHADGSSAMISHQARCSHACIPDSSSTAAPGETSSQSGKMGMPGCGLCRPSPAETDSKVVSEMNNKMRTITENNLTGMFIVPGGGEWKCSECGCRVKRVEWDYSLDALKIYHGDRAFLLVPEQLRDQVRLENDLNAGDCPVCDNWEDGNGNLIINRLRGYVE